MSEEALLTQRSPSWSFQLLNGKSYKASIRRKIKRLAVICLGTYMAGWAYPASAQQFTIENANTKLVDQVYTLNASLKYSFSDEALKALENGVSLILALDIEVLKPRRYMWDEEIATLEQRYELQYLALTDQYLLANKNSGAQHVYHSLDEALSTLEHIDDLPLIDSHLLDKDERYKVQVRSRLDIDSLPVPLRLSAYFSGSWFLDSGWYSWDL